MSATSISTLGHVHIFRGLARQAGLNAAQEMALFEALQRKAIPEVRSLVDEAGVAEPRGRHAVPARRAERRARDRSRPRARSLAPAAADGEGGPGLSGAAWRTTWRRVAPTFPVHYDLAELRAYQYQTGIVFAAFVMGQGDRDCPRRAIRRHRQGLRPGTPRHRLQRRPADPAAARAAAGAGSRDAVLAPWSDDPALQELVARLRAEGRQVIWELPGQSGDAPPWAAAVFAAPAGRSAGRTREAWGKTGAVACRDEWPAWTLSTKSTTREQANGKERSGHRHPVG